MSEIVASTFNPRLAVIIPTHNRWHEARISLACLERSGYRNFEIVLVEDGCTDGTAENCRKEFPSVRLLHGDGNLWWSGAINMGLDYALAGSFDAVVWLNDDNRVEPETLGRLVESFERKGARSIIVSRIKTAGTEADEWTGGPPPWHAKFKEWTPPDFRSATEVAIEYPPGGQGVLIPSGAFAEVGRVDARAFPHYWADHDFHFRALRAGYKYFISTRAVVHNVPNERRPQYDTIHASLRGARWFLFDQRSSMNPVILRRMIKRHLPPRDYRQTFYPLLWQQLKWLASGWAANKPVLHKSLRFVKRNLLAWRRA